MPFFFFSLFHQRADDEALTRFLQTSLFLVASPILVKSILKQALLTPTTGFSLVYDLGSPVVSTPAGRGSTSPSEGGPVDVVAHFFYSNPSSCKSFLVSCQMVTNPLLVG